MIRVVRAALAGVAGALAYLAEQELDRRVANPRSDDLVLLGGMLTTRSSAWRPLGLGMHLAAGAVFGIAFEAVIAPLLRGPYWLRGAVMGQVENALLWPLIPIVDRVHPAVRVGALAPLNRRVYFAQAVLRHVALGAVLGLVLGAPRVERPG
jgi:hypothetical protein